MPWVPIGHRVLVKPDEKYEVEVGVNGEQFRKQGEIYVPEAVAERETYAWNQGELIDWGPTAGMHFDGKTMEELGLHRGDKILYNQYAGLTFKDENGVGFRVINDQDLNMRWVEPEMDTQFVPSEEAVDG